MTTATVDQRASMLFYGLDTEGLLTGAWTNMSYESLPEHVINALRRVVIASMSQSAKVPMGDPLTRPGDARREDARLPYSATIETNAAPQLPMGDPHPCDMTPEERERFFAAPSETPETDALMDDQDAFVLHGPALLIRHARQLERQRDEAVAHYDRVLDERDEARRELDETRAKYERLQQSAVGCQDRLEELTQSASEPVNIPEGQRQAIRNEGKAGVNVNVFALNKAMDLAGKGTTAGYCRTISPQHYASASGLEWYSARRQLNDYAQVGIVVKRKNGTFYVNAMDFDD